MVRIRLLDRDEVDRVQEIELAAGQLFADIGMHDIAAHPPPGRERLHSYRVAERAWVLDVGGTVAGFVLVDVVDGNSHIEQISVHPEFGRRGLGRRLGDHVAESSRESGRAAVTLTTFRHVAWNAPLYEQWGYRVLAEDERGPELTALVAEEAELGLDPELRVAMRLDLR
jgi:ribosomal protein S18 acetylase RimI-like enzyme